MIKIKEYVDWESAYKLAPGICYTVPDIPVVSQRDPGGLWKHYNYGWEKVTDNLARYLADKYIPLQTEGDFVSPKTYKVSYEGNPDSPSKPFFVRHKVKNRVENFKELCDAGVIVMNNYEVSSFLLEPKPGEVRISDEVYSSYGYDDSHFHRYRDEFDYNYITANYTVGPPPMSSYSRPVLYMGNRWITQSSNAAAVPLRRTRYEVVQPPPALAKSIIEHNRRFRGFDSVLIQQNSASANNGDSDALTALAEMPELIESIVDGFLLLKKGAVGARSRQLTLTKQSAKKAKARREKEFGLNAKFPSYATFVRRGGDPKDYTKFKETFLKSNRKDRTAYAEKRLAQLRLQEAEELGDAVSGVWLNYRYNISPTVYMIQDTIKAMHRLLDTYKTTRSGLNYETSFDCPTGWHFDGEVRVRNQVCTKRIYAWGDKLDRLNRSFGFDFFVTALERVPLWGIIVNWFVTAADFLRALNWVPKHKQSVTCFSQKIKISGKLIFGPNTPTSPYWDVDGTAYYRYVIDPVDHLGIHFKLNITSERKLDALAFFWSKDSKNYLKR